MLSLFHSFIYGCPQSKSRRTVSCCLPSCTEVWLRTSGSLGVLESGQSCLRRIKRGESAYTAARARGAARVGLAVARGASAGRSHFDDYSKGGLVVFELLRKCRREVMMFRKRSKPWE